jgi:hypothetical protein
MYDSPAFSMEDFLASPAELVAVLAHFADSNRRYSTQHRRDRQLAQEALATLLPVKTLAEPAVLLDVEEPPGASIPVTDRTIASVKGPAVGISRVQGRQYCQCGKCKWCLDNARWERVFEEKFADPAYYGPIRVMHNSSLAGGY